MVDSPQERTMTNGSSDLPERVGVIEQKLDGLIQSVDARFAQVDTRFDQVDAAIIEQRAYTEFAYEKLDSKMDAGFARLDRKMDAGFARLDQKIDDIDNRLGKVDGRFARLETKIDRIIDLHVPKTPPDVSTSE
jgi:archaellum component FlaC